MKTYALRQKFPPPGGSHIRCVADDDRLLYQWPPRSGTGDFLGKCVITVFASWWLFCWAMSWLLLLYGFTSGEAELSPLFIVWMWGWLAGGVFCIFMVYRMHRPGEPESIGLTPDTLAYNSGAWSPRGDIKNLPSRVRTTLHKKDIQKLTLLRDDQGLHLMVAYGNLEVEAGRHLNDAETQWLEEVLQSWLAAPGRGC